MGIKAQVYILDAFNVEGLSISRHSRGAPDVVTARGLERPMNPKHHIIVGTQIDPAVQCRLSLLSASSEHSQGTDRWFPSILPISVRESGFADDINDGQATVIQPWACPTCRVTVTTPFCPACGEHPLQPRDLTLRGLFGQVVQIFSNIDSRVVRSFRCLVMEPGALTLAFVNGQRKPYIGAFQLFILTNVLFFAVQSFTGMKIFSNSLDFRLHGQQWSEFGQMLMGQRLAATGRTFAQYAPVFDQAVAVNAKSLIGLMVPAFALVAPLVFWRSNRPFAAHIVFALHFYAFLLLLFCVPLTAMTIDSAIGGDGVLSQRSDDVMSVTVVLVCAGYLYAAIGPAYCARGPLRTLQAVMLTVAAAYIFFAYRFALLPITLYTT